MSEMALPEAEREWRVAGNMGNSGRHEVCLLTEHGLQVVIGQLERWQALAIVAILDHPYGD